jgi:hypothetical protein
MNIKDKIITLHIDVADRHATYKEAPKKLVCGNPFRLVFSFDAEWDEFANVPKKAKLVFWHNGRPESLIIEFVGDTCNVPALFGIKVLEVGVFVENNICTTTGAHIDCELSIRCLVCTNVLGADAIDNINAALKGEKGDPGPKGEKGEKGDPTEVVQETGDSEDAVMSQKAVTAELGDRLKREELPGNATGGLTNNVIIATPMNADGTFDKNFRYPLDYASDSGNSTLKDKQGQPFDKRHYAKRIVQLDGKVGVVMHSNRQQKLDEGLISENKFVNYEDHDEPYYYDGNDESDPNIERKRFTIAARDGYGRLVVEDGVDPFHAVNYRQLINYVDANAIDIILDNRKYANKVDYCELDSTGRAVNTTVFHNGNPDSYLTVASVDSDANCPTYPLPVNRFISKKDWFNIDGYYEFDIPEHLTDKKFSAGFWMRDNMSGSWNVPMTSYRLSLTKASGSMAKYTGKPFFTLGYAESISNSTYIVDKKLGDWYHIVITVDNAKATDKYTKVGIGSKGLSNGCYLEFTTPVMVEDEQLWYVQYPNVSYAMPIKAGSPVSDNDATNKKYVDNLVGDISSALDELHTYAQSLVGGNV